MMPLEQYRTLLEATPTLIWRAGVDGGCDYFNETWLAFTGRSLAQELGDGWAVGVHPDDLARVMHSYRECFDRRQPFELEYRLRRHDGVYRWIVDRGAPFYDEHGAFGGYVGSCLDVHERRTLDESKATFLAMLAHELRTPLQALVFFADIAREASTLGQPLPLETIERLERQVARLRWVGEHAFRGIGTLHALPSLDRRALDLVALVSSLIAVQRASGLRRDVAIELEIVGEPQPVFADATHMREAIAALLDNAAKFSPEAGLVDVRIEFRDHEAVIAIGDRGVGVPEGEIDRLGTPFFRASNAPPRQYPGLGLGLSVARNVALAHGGRLRFQARPPNGLAATLEWPRADPYVVEESPH